MACREITSPLTGETVISKTWSDIRSLVETDDRADELYEQLMSPEFINWFGDWINDPQNASKVVNEYGEPLVVYHGSREKFDKFNRDFIGNGSGYSNLGQGFYFGSNRQLAEGYASYTGPMSEPDDNGILYPVYLNIKNSKDGIIEGNEYVAFEPNQIKSVFNEGVFDTSNDNIYADESFINPDEIFTEIRVLGALKSGKVRGYDPSKNKGEGFFNDILKQGVSKEQLEVVKEVVKGYDKLSAQEVANLVQANYGYKVEAKTTMTVVVNKDSKYGAREDFVIGTDIYMYTDNGIDDLYYKNDQRISLEAYGEAKLKANTKSPTQYYSNLTVPGGTNYIENEISTPGIVPSIKGHAQFSTDNGIGWFRSDDKHSIVRDSFPEIVRKKAENPNVYDDLNKIKTRRILEVQSDLFQKGRDKDDLITKDPYTGGTYNAEDNQYEPDMDAVVDNWENDTRRGQLQADLIEMGLSPEEARREANKDNITKNTFLQFLNKDGNWIKFFIKTILQDSAKKGYEKVLFPAGDTASKVEGHETIEGFIADKKRRLQDIVDLMDGAQKEYEEGNVYDQIGSYHRTSENKYYFINDYPVNIPRDERMEPSTEGEFINAHQEKLEGWIIEKDQLEMEISRVEEQGFGALKPIWNFYENTVQDILKKIYGKENVTRTKDEYFNDWFELEIKPERDTSTILFDEDFSKKDIKELPFRFNVSKLHGSTIVLQPKLHAMSTYKDPVSEKLVNLIPLGKYSLSEYLAVSGLTKNDFVKKYILPDQKDTDYIKNFLSDTEKIYIYRIDSVSKDKDILPTIDDIRYSKLYDNRLATLQILKTTLSNTRDEATRKIIRAKIKILRDQIATLEKDESRTLLAILGMLMSDIDAVEEVLNNNADWRSLNYAASLLANYNNMFTNEFKDVIDQLDEKTKLEILSFINRVNDQSERIQNKLFELGNNSVRDRTGNNIIVDDILVPGVDKANSASKYTRDTTENINPIVQTLTYLIKRAMTKINGRYNKFTNDHKSIVKNLISFQKNKGLKADDYYEYMLQRDSKDKRTGYVIDELSSDYSKALIESRKIVGGELLFYAQNHSFKIDQDAWKAKRAELIEYYKNMYGDNVELTEYDEMVGTTIESKIQKSAARYAERHNPNTMVNIMTRINKDPKLMSKSDIAFFDYFTTRGGLRASYIDNKRVNIVTINAKDRWKDPKWVALQKLLKSDPRKVFYEHYTQQIDAYRKATKDEQFKMKWNYIPEKTKKLPVVSLSGIRQYMVDNVSQVISSNIHGIDPITGEISKAIPLYMMKGDIKAEDKSYDLGDVLMSSTREYMNYEEKKAIEDDANLLLYTLKNQKVAKLNADGTQVVINGVPQWKPGLSNNYEMAKYRLDAQLYDERQDKELVSKFKLRDENSRIKLKEIKLQMSALNLSQKEQEDAHSYYNQGQQYIGTNNKITEYIKLLKQRAHYTNTNVKYVTGNKVANLLMYYTSVKFLGLNLFAGIGELLQGTLSLFTESAGKRWFTDRQAFKAMGIMMGLRGPGNYSKTGHKVSGLSKIFDVLGKVFQESEQNNVVSKVAFSMYAGSNYIVNNSFMLATLMHEKVKDKNGKEYSVYDVIDIKEDGTAYWTNKDIEVDLMDSEGVPSEYLTSLIFKVKEVLKNNRDRQTSDDPILLEKSILGRVLGQFKKNWLFRAFYNRWGDHREADLFSTKDFKGYYRSVLDAFAPVMSEDPLTGEQSTGIGGIAKGIAKGTTTLLRATALARVFGQGFKEGELSELDEVNLRKFLREMSFVITISVTILLLSSLSGDDDDDRSFMRTWGINQLRRLQRDMTTYMHPSSLASIVKNPAPVLSTVTDIMNVLGAIHSSTLLMDPYVHEGTKNEELRVLKAVEANIPFVNQIDRMSNKLNKNINYTY